MRCIASEPQCYSVHMAGGTYCSIGRDAIQFLQSLLVMHSSQNFGVGCGLVAAWCVEGGWVSVTP